MATAITKSNGDLYADLGTANAEAHAPKAEIVRHISAAMSSVS